MATDNQATFPGFQFPNTTQIPNDVFDTLMSHLFGGELKVLLYICRRTFGFRKDSDSISLTQIAQGITTKAGRVLDQGTGLSKRQVQRALRVLENRKVILVERKVDATGLHEINTYRLNVRGSDNMIAQSAVTRLMQDYPAAYIREKLAMAKGLVASGSALISQNPAGWLRRAIEEDYSPPRTVERHRQHHVRERRMQRSPKARRENSVWLRNLSKHKLYPLSRKQRNRAEPSQTRQERTKRSGIRHWKNYR
jgi:hypothetical protein